MRGGGGSFLRWRAQRETEDMEGAVRHLPKPWKDHCSQQRVRRMKKTGRVLIVFFIVALFPIISAGDVQRVKIPLEGSPSMGTSNPSVTIVEFLDYQ